MDFFEALAQNLRNALGDAAATAAFWGGGGPREGKKGPWNTVRIDGEVFPGVKSYDDPGACIVLDPKGKVGYRVDSQKVKGRSGHKLHVEGYQPTPFTLTFKIVTPAEWAAFTAYLPRLNPKLKENQAKARRIEFPSLTAYQIAQVYVSDLSFPEPAGESRMIKEVHLTCWEVFDVKKHGGGGVTQTDTSGAIKVAQPFQNVDGQADVEERSPVLKHSGRRGGRR